MLKEIRNARENLNDSRRIFADDYFDLYVWIESDDSISGFQLCYGESNNRKVLTWKNSKGFSHNSIDSGESNFGKSKSSPILMPDGHFNKDDTAERFEKESLTIDRKIRDFVLEKLTNYQQRKFNKNNAPDR